MRPEIFLEKKINWQADETRIKNRFYLHPAAFYDMCTVQKHSARLLHSKWLSMEDWLSLTLVVIHGAFASCMLLLTEALTSWQPYHLRQRESERSIGDVVSVLPCLLGSVYRKNWSPIWCVKTRRSEGRDQGSCREQREMQYQNKVWMELFQMAEITAE